MVAETEGVWQPIDPEFEQKLDAKYVKFYKASLLHRPTGADQIPWSSAIRDTPAVMVGSVID